jgi:hypothetical protein
MELNMTETKPTEKNVPPVTPDPIKISAKTPGNQNQAQHRQSPETIKASVLTVEKGDITGAKPSSAAETKPLEMQPRPTKNAIQQKSLWVMLSIVLLLLFVLILLFVQPRQKRDIKNISTQQESSEEKSELSNYSAFVSKNPALQEKEISEQVLTDEIFAGQAPLAVTASGPLISQDVDPLLAAMADAFKRRLQIFQDSQSFVRGNTVTRTTKGDIHGFKISVLEKRENEQVVFEEITLVTPGNGVVKTVNHVLDMVQKTDFPGINAEIQKAGLEFTALPIQTNKQILRGQLRSLRNWGKLISAELLIAGKSVGGIELGMPTSQLKIKLPASYEVLKRKVLVTDTYYDVYKIVDANKDPLFYVYEKKGKVWGISIVSEIFKTARGIGIGSNLDMMRISYPVIRMGHSEKKTPYVKVEEVTGLFIIQGEGEKRIISILIGESPEFE